MTSLIIECLNACTEFYSSAGVVCGSLRGLGYMGRRADIVPVQEALQVPPVRCRKGLLVLPGCPACAAGNQSRTS